MRDPCRPKSSTVRPLRPAARGRNIIAIFTLLLTAAAPPTRVASLNLCTDELALLLAAPGQLASVTWLAAEPRETALAPRARGLLLNNGRLEDIAALRPDLVLTSGPATRYAAELAQRMGTRVLDVPSPATTADVRANVRAVAAALGRPGAATPVLAAFDHDLGPPIAARTRALLIQGGGYAPPPNGLAAAFLGHAGLAQMPTQGGHVDFERLLINPPQVVVTANYRATQISRAQSWFAHPALGHLPSRRLAIDGRAWTCMGPLAARALPGLRAELAR